MKKFLFAIIIVITFFILQPTIANATKRPRLCKETICITKVFPIEGDVVLITNETRIVIEYILPEGKEIDTQKSSIIIDGQKKPINEIRGNQLIIKETGLSGIGNRLIKVEAQIFDSRGLSDKKEWAFYTENSEIPFGEVSSDDSKYEFSNIQKAFFIWLSILTAGLFILLILFVYHAKKIKNR